MLEEFIPFVGLIIFGNIENLILSSQGVVNGVDPKVLGGLSIIAVIAWLIIGFVATDLAIQYSNYITFIGGLAIVILGLISVKDAIINLKQDNTKTNMITFNPYTSHLYFKISYMYIRTFLKFYSIREMIIILDFI